MERDGEGEDDGVVKVKEGEGRERRLLQHQRDTASSTRHPNPSTHLEHNTTNRHTIPPRSTRTSLPRFQHQHTPRPRSLSTLPLQQMPRDSSARNPAADDDSLSLRGQVGRAAVVGQRVRRVLPVACGRVGAGGRDGDVGAFVHVPFGGWVGGGSGCVSWVGCVGLLGVCGLTEGWLGLGGLNLEDYRGAKAHTNPSWVYLEGESGERRCFWGAVVGNVTRGEAGKASLDGRLAGLVVLSDWPDSYRVSETHRPSRGTPPTAGQKIIKSIAGGRGSKPCLVKIGRANYLGRVVAKETGRAIFDN